MTSSMDTPAIDMSKMTEYDKCEHRLSEQMQRIWNNILARDKLNQAICDDTLQLEEGTLEACRYAKAEGRKEEFEKLLKKTQLCTGNDYVSLKASADEQRVEQETSQVNSRVSPRKPSPSAAALVSREMTEQRFLFGGHRKQDEPAVDMSKMTEYEKCQYRLAEQMLRIRNNNLELCSLTDDASVSRRIDLKQAIRKDTMQLVEGTKEARRYAKEEGRKEEYEKLLTHVKKTQDLLNAENQTTMSPHDDQEFKKFFDEVSKTDEEIDQALDTMVSGAGDAILHQKAKQMLTELKDQQDLITTVEKKMDNFADQNTANTKAGASALSKKELEDLL